MIHPSGIQTTDYEVGERYEPTPWQIANAARRANVYYVRPRYRPNPVFALLITLLSLVGLVKLFISIL